MLRLEIVGKLMSEVKERRDESKSVYVKRLKKERSRLRLCYDDRENCVGNDIVESAS